MCLQSTMDAMWAYTIKTNLIHILSYEVMISYCKQSKKLIIIYKKFRDSPLPNGM